MTTVVLHCSDSKFGNAAEISKWHVLPVPDGRGWKSIGYHYIILNGHLSPTHFNRAYNGHVETGRPLDDDSEVEFSEKGAHNASDNMTIGVCLIGKSGEFTENQFGSLVHLLVGLNKQFGGIVVKQHSDYDSKKPFCAGLHPETIKAINLGLNKK